jgi:4-amino-4-deoxy-L-arabinose transferase-like glycosyltransferase
MPAFRRRSKLVLDWFRPVTLLSFCIVCLPWYILVIQRNGFEFVRVFFIQQHFSRFGSAALQHVQPWWFYAPIFLLLLFPWFPLLFAPSISAPARLRGSVRFQTLGAVVVFGLLFFSASLNKLPGYLVPLLPAVFAILGVGVSSLPSRVSALVFPVLLIGLLPAAVSFAPDVLGAHGVHPSFPYSALWIPLLVCGVSATALFVTSPRLLFPFAAGLAGMAFLWFQFAAFPAFDAKGSARPLSKTALNCTPGGPRDVIYGLYYYAGRELPKCTIVDPNGTRVVR